MKAWLLVCLVALAGASSLPQDELEKVETPGQISYSDGCQPHATRRKCGSSCPPTCTHQRTLCMSMICDNSCYCDTGFVLNSNTEKCVRLSECTEYNPDENLAFAEDYPNVESDVEPTTGNDQAVDPDMCQGNSTHTTCGTACPLTCENVNSPPMMCTMQCVIGCQCQKGYLLTSDKERCILPDDCY